LSSEIDLESGPAPKVSPIKSPILSENKFKTFWEEFVEKNVDDVDTGYYIDEDIMLLAAIAFVLSGMAYCLP